MNAKERFLETARLGGNPDRVFFNGVLPMFEPARKLTLERWRREGLPSDVNPTVYFGMDRVEAVPINLGPVPPFKEVILEENERYRVFIDDCGIKQRGFKADWEGGFSGFATRQWLEFPVKIKEDFGRMKERYNPHSPCRYPEWWNDWTRCWNNRTYPLGIEIKGIFMWTRDLVGLQKMSIYFFTNPTLIKEIIDFYVDFLLKALHTAVNEVELDFAYLDEDLAYKGGPMISPSIFREFILPGYKKLAHFFRKHGIDIIIVDSDGNPDLLIPLWLEAGMNGFTPCEVAAGADPVDLRERYGEKLIIMGGIDKRILSQNKNAIKKEVMSKVPHLINIGGYFPGVDHAVPPDVSLENYLYYLKLVRSLCDSKKSRAKLI